MATLPGLVLKIGANTKDAIDGLNKVNGAVGKSASGADKARASWKKAGPALAAAAAAAGALAIKLGVDAVQAAAQEEAELAKLNQTLANLGFGDASAQVNKFVDDLQFSVGVADSELRPALALLVGSFHDVAKAEQMLGLATDLAAAGFGSVESAAAALGKAAGGNLGALQRLVKGGIDPATVKAKDFEGAVAQLTDLVGGQAARAADTLAGRMRILKIGTDELQESFGKGLIDGFLGAGGTGGLKDAADQLRSMQTSAENFGKTIGGLAQIALGAFDIIRGTVISAVFELQQRFNTFYDWYISIMDALPEALGGWTDAQVQHERSTQDAIKAAQKQAYYEDLLGYKFGETADAADGATTSTNDYTSALAAQEAQATKSKTSLQRLQAQMDRMSKNRSIAGQLISLAETRAKGPGKKENLRSFGLGYADQAAQLAQDIAERGNFSEKAKARARRILANARGYLGGLGLGENFTSRNGDFLGTPNALRAGTPNSRAAGRVTDESQKMGTTINIDTINVNTPTVAEAIQRAKEAARLRGLNSRLGGAVPAGALT